MADDAAAGVKENAPGRVSHRPLRVPTSFDAPAIVGHSSNPSLTAFLSVMILVLAFFVLLNSISKEDPERESKVLQSIDFAFGNVDGAGDGQTSSGIATSEHSPVLEATFERLRSLVPVDGRVKRVRADEVQISFPANWLFPADKSNLSSEARVMFGEMRNLMEGRPAGWDYEMEVGIAAVEARDIDFERAGVLASLLTGTDSPERVTSVAIEAVRGDWISVTIRLRGPGLPDLPER